MISRTNIALAVLLGAVVLLATFSGVDYSKPNVEVLANSSMKYTPASTPYESSQVFANGMTQQEPIPGTIARGEMPLYFTPLPQAVDPQQVAPKDSVPGMELVNPFSITALLQQAHAEAKRNEQTQKNAVEPSDSSGDQTDPEVPESTQSAGKASETISVDSNAAGQAFGDNNKPADAEKTESPSTVAHRLFQASIDRGNDIYLSFCVCCHGPAGKGDGMVAQRGYPPPPSYLIGTSIEWNDGQLFHILTYGRNNMPRFAAELPRDSRWDVINYVRTLQAADATPGPDEQNGPEVTPSKEKTIQAPLSDDELQQNPKAGSSAQPAGDKRALSKTDSKTEP